MSKDCFGIGGAEPYSYVTIMSVYLHILCCPNWTEIHFSL